MRNSPRGCLYQKLTVALESNLQASMLEQIQLTWVTYLRTCYLASACIHFVTGTQESCPQNPRRALWKRQAFYTCLCWHCDHCWMFLWRIRTRRVLLNVWVLHMLLRQWSSNDDMPAGLWLHGNIATSYKTQARFDGNRKDIMCMTWPGNVHVINLVIRCVHTLLCALWMMLSTPCCGNVPQPLNFIGA